MNVEPPSGVERLALAAADVADPQAPARDRPALGCGRCLARVVSAAPDVAAACRGRRRRSLAAVAAPAAARGQDAGEPGDQPGRPCRLENVPTRVLALEDLDALALLSSC